MTQKDKLLADGIRHKRLELEQQAAVIADDLASLQEACPHPNLTKTYHSNSGNYDPSADSEWYQFVCPDCGKRWQQDKQDAKRSEQDAQCSEPRPPIYPADWLE